MNIEAGKFYKLRNGYKVRIDATDYHGSFPIHGCLIPSMDFLMWTNQGRRSELQREEPLDIVGEWIDPPKPLEFWANVCQCNSNGELFTGTLFKSRKEVPVIVESTIATYKFLRTSKFIEVLE